VRADASAERAGAIGLVERPWVRERLLPFAVLVIGLPLGLFTSWTSLYWLVQGGRPFPGFFVMERAIVPTVGLYHWTGMVHGMPFTARILAVDDVPVASNGDVYAHVARVPEGTPVSYTVLNAGRVETRRIPTMRFTSRDYGLILALFVLNGLAGLGVGIVVGLLRPHSPAARAFVLWGFFWGLYLTTATTLYHPDLAWLARVHYLMATFFPATFLHFGLVFPVEYPLVQRRPWLLVLPYVPSAAIFLWLLRSYFGEPPSWLPQQAMFLYSGLSIPALIGLLAYSYWQNRTPMVRPRLQSVIPGIAVAAATGIYGFVSIALDGTFPINLVALTPVVFFVSIAYAIVAHDAFDITRLLRRTALYFALTLAIATGYAVILAVVSRFVPASEVVASAAFQVPAFVLLGLVFQPLHRRMQAFIDETFFRRGVDYRRAVSGVSAALTSVLDLDEIFQQVGDVVTTSFALHGFTAVVWADGDETVWRVGTRAGSAQEMTTLRERLEVGDGRPLVLVDYETGESTDEALVSTLGHPAPALVVPVHARGAVLGAFLLGRKRSGLPFSRDDLELLETLSAQSAIAIQNALSYRSLQELAASLEDRVQRRTSELERSNAELARKHDEVERARAEAVHAYDELRTTQRRLVQSEKMASLGQLVAGVAHEINNPVSFIVGNVGPLRRKLAALGEAANRHDDAELRALVERVGRILETIGRGAERTAGIVQDLRTFSRMGDAERVPCDLEESVEVSLRLLKPKWQERVAIERDYGGVGQIRAVPGQINQVLMNILANACDAIIGAGTIRIATAHDGDVVRLTIADDGAGMPAEVLDRIFDPFFTTKPQGQGTGLGLSISHGIVADHGGQIDVESRVGVGTTFTVRLPVDVAAAG